jgi:hypothetical protein
MDPVQAGFWWQLAFGILAVIVIAHYSPFFGMAAALVLFWWYSHWGSMLF